MNCSFDVDNQLAATGWKTQVELIKLVETLDNSCDGKQGKAKASMIRAGT